MIANDARCTREIKSRTVMEKVAFNKKILFTGKLDLNPRKKLEEFTGGASHCIVLKVGHRKVYQK